MQMYFNLIEVNLSSFFQQFSGCTRNPTEQKIEILFQLL